MAINNKVTCLLALTLLTWPGSLHAAQGSFDSDHNLTLHAYFDHAESQENLTGVWLPFFEASAEAWFDALEGHSRIKKLYVFNHIPEGKSRADVVLQQRPPGERADYWNAFADHKGFRNGKYVTIIGMPYVDAQNRDRYTRTLAHELGHLIFDLRDCYGGQFREAATRRLLPLQYIAADPPPEAYRSYMWSDQWLRDPNGPKVMVQNLQTPHMRVFYEAGGGQGMMAWSLMDGGYIPGLGPEFSTAGTHIREFPLRMKFPAYDYLDRGRVSMRAADSDFRDYLVSNNQEEAHHKSEWEVVADYLGITAPTTLSLNALTADQRPEIIVLDGSGVVICLDKSGSMEQEHRLTFAKLGAQVTVNWLRARQEDGTPGEFAGVTSFDDVAYLDAYMREILGDATRGELKAAIGAITSGGATSIGDGLRLSLNTLLALANPQQKVKTIILLSDGQHNSGEHPDGVIPDLLANDVTVYTVALGSDADRDLLGHIAAATGGQMFVAASPSDIARYFLTIRADAAGDGTIGQRTVELAPSQTHVEPVLVESGVDRVAFSAVTDNPLIQFALRRPDGTVVNPGSADTSVSYRTAGPQRLYEVLLPAPGSWQMLASRPAVTSGGPFAKTEIPPLPIYDFDTVSSLLVITNPGSIAGLKVAVDIHHTYVGDLTVWLTSPLGKTVLLHNRSGGSDDDIVGTYGLDLIPAESLDVFDGDPISGIWTLTLNDSGFGDNGALNSWSLAYTGATGSGSVSLLAVNSNPGLTVQAGIETPQVNFPDPLVVHVSLQAGGSVVGADVSARVSTPNGGTLTVPLFDDGDAVHGDARPDDGVYSASFRDYVGSGVYEFSITASNSNGFIGGISEYDNRPVPVPPFVRTLTVQGLVSNAPNVSLHWLAINQFQSTVVPTVLYHDSLKMVGGFNLEMPGSFIATNQGLTVRAGSFVRTFNPGAWKRIGRTQKYVQTRSNYNATVDYFIGGSSRSKFTFSARKSDLRGAFPNPFDVPVGLVLGGAFDETLHLQLDAQGNSYKLGSDPPEPLFFIDTLNITRNLTRTNSDSLVMSGRVMGDFSFNPSFNGLDLEVGPFLLQLPPGFAPAPIRGTRIIYRNARPGGPSVTLTYDYDKGTISVRVSKASFVGVANPVAARLALTNIAGTSWNYRLNLQELPGGRTLRY